MMMDLMNILNIIIIHVQLENTSVLTKRNVLMKCYGVMVKVILPLVGMTVGMNLMKVLTVSTGNVILITGSVLIICIVSS